MQRFPSAWRRGVYEAIQRRRDMRAFRPDPIPRPLLARILAAAHHAGSVGFSQPWNFIVVEDRALRRTIHAHVDAERLRAAAGFDAARRAQYLTFKLEGILEAPLNLCITCDRRRFGPAVIGRNTMPDTDLYSTCGAIQNLWLAARAEGVGVGWVSLLDPQEVGALLGVPDHVVVVAYLCVGWVEAFPERPMLETRGWLPRLPLADVVFADRWGQPPAADLAQALAQALATETAATDAGRPTTANGAVAVEQHGRWLIVQLGTEHTLLSWAIVGGGQRTGRTVAWYWVDEGELDVARDPRALLEERLAAIGLGDAVGLMTGRNVARYADARTDVGEIWARCIVAAGLSNALCVGDPPGTTAAVGTINLLCVVSVPLTDEAQLETLALASEARTAALLAHAVPSASSGRPASGTGTDCIVIAAPQGGVAEPYAGKHTAVGSAVGAAVSEAVDRAVREWLSEREPARAGSPPEPR